MLTKAIVSEENNEVNDATAALKGMLGIGKTKTTTTSTSTTTTTARVSQTGEQTGSTNTATNASSSSSTVAVFENDLLTASSTTAVSSAVVNETQDGAAAASKQTNKKKKNKKKKNNQSNTNNKDEGGVNHNASSTEAGNQVAIGGGKKQKQPQQPHHQYRKNNNKNSTGGPTTANHPSNNNNNNKTAKADENFAWSAFQSSPDASTLPIPAFASPAVTEQGRKVITSEVMAEMTETIGPVAVTVESLESTRVESLTAEEQVEACNYLERATLEENPEDSPSAAPMSKTVENYKGILSGNGASEGSTGVLSIPADAWRPASASAPWWCSASSTTMSAAMRTRRA